MNCFAVPIDETFPRYLVENQEKYRARIFPVTPDYLRRVRCARLLRTLQGRWIRFAERACPPALHNFLHLVKMKLIR